MPEPIQSRNFAVQIRKPDGTWEPLNVAQVELSYSLDEPIPAQPIVGSLGDVSVSFTVNTRGWKALRAKTRRAQRRIASFDLAAPHRDVSVGMLVDARADGSFRVLDTWPRKHICSALASRLRAQFPRLKPAQIERLARVIRRTQGRSIPIRPIQASASDLIRTYNRLWRGVK